MTDLNACDVMASDNYGMTYTYDQVVNTNGVQLYNATTKAKEDPKAPWTFVIVWKQDGALRRPTTSARCASSSPRRPTSNQVADGHSWSSG